MCVYIYISGSIPISSVSIDLRSTPVARYLLLLVEIKNLRAFFTPKRVTTLGIEPTRGSRFWKVSWFVCRRVTQ